MRFSKSLLFVGLVLFASVATATPVFWNLNNVLFDDGTSVAGSFTMDADTSTFSALSMTTSGGTSVPAESTWFFAPGLMDNVSGAAGFVAVDSLAADLTGAHLISLFVTDGSLFTNGGGTLNIEFFVAGTCADSNCAGFNINDNFSRSGSGQFVSGAAVPEPTTFILGGSVLLLGGFRRRFTGIRNR